MPRVSPVVVFWFSLLLSCLVFSCFFFVNFSLFVFLAEISTSVSMLTFGLSFGCVEKIISPTGVTQHAVTVNKEHHYTSLNDAKLNTLPSIECEAVYLNRL